MTKTCPNCGVNSPDNAKHCIECGENIEDVPINKKKEPQPNPKTTSNTSSSSSNDNSSWMGCIILIAIVAVVIVAAGFFIFGGSGESNQQNVSITFSDVYVSNFLSNNEIVYDYFVNGYFKNIPNDNDKYMIKTIYYGSDGKELASTTEKLSKFKNDEKKDYPTMISFYQTKNYIDVDHVTVQIMKDNAVVNEFTTQMNKNKLTSNVGSSSSVNNSSNSGNLSR